MFAVVTRIGSNSCNTDYACDYQEVDVLDNDVIDPDAPTQYCPDGVTCGEGSCRTPSSCVGALGPTIGAGSCLEMRSCDSAQGPIGDDSCTWRSSCQNAKASIGSGSCQGQSSCSQSRGDIGDGSCIGDGACGDTRGSIGDGSCPLGYSCGNAGGNIGDGSCTGNRACNQKLTGDVGTGSCTAYNSCAYSTMSIGSNSCLTDSVCYQLQTAVGDNDGPAGDVWLTALVADVLYKCVEGKDTCGANAPGSRQKWTYVAKPAGLVLGANTQLSATDGVFDITTEAITFTASPNQQYTFPFECQCSA